MKSTEKTPRDPSHKPSGVHDPAERSLLVYLRALARRASWRLTELPDEAAFPLVDMVRMLDVRGWIDARRWLHPGVLCKSGHEPIPNGDIWSKCTDGVGSPINTWEYAFALSRDRPSLACEIRVSERGRASLAEAGLVPAGPNGDTRNGKPNEATPKKPGCKPAKGTELTKRERQVFDILKTAREGGLRVLNKNLAEQLGMSPSSFSQYKALLRRKGRLQGPALGRNVEPE